MFGWAGIGGNGHRGSEPNELANVVGDGALARVEARAIGTHHPRITTHFARPRTPARDRHPYNAGTGALARGPDSCGACVKAALTARSGAASPLYRAVMEPLQSLPLPEDPVLAQCASAVNDAGYWALILDASWRLVFATDEVRLSYGDTGAATSVPIGHHYFGAELARFRETTPVGCFGTLEARREWFRRMGPYVLAGTAGGRESLRRVVNPELSDLVDELEPLELPQVLTPGIASFSFEGAQVVSPITFYRIDDEHGHFAGVVTQAKPAAGMSQLGAAAATADLAHLERMRLVERPDRRPAAILIADLEASSPLARRLSTAHYFAFGDHLVRAADQCIIDEGGIVGRHAGDGVTAFFLAETAGSESQAARSCIAASRALRAALGEVAARTESRRPRCRCGSGSTGARPCMWDGSSPPVAAK